MLIILIYYVLDIVNLFGIVINTNKEAVLGISLEIDLEVNLERAKYMFM